MLALIVLIADMARQKFRIRRKLSGDVRHFGDLLGNRSVIYRLIRVAPPCEDAVVRNKAGGYAARVAHRFVYHDSGVLFVLVHFIRAERASTGNVTVEIIRVRRAVYRHGAACLRKRSGVRGMRMHHAADARGKARRA